jgi:Uma2 family endonuclease
MSTVTTPLMTADEFFDWANRPENQGRYWELDEGKVIEMPPPGNVHGAVASWISYLLWQYVIRVGHGYVVGNDAGLVVQKQPDTVRGPDLMLFAESRPLEAIARKYTTDVPRLIVEISSPNDRQSRLQKRIGQYLRRGVPLVWLVDPEDRTLTVYRPGEIHRVLEEPDDLTGNGVLPEFRCRVADLFTLPGGQPT